MNAISQPLQHTLHSHESALKIRAVQCIPVRLPLIKPILMAGIEMHHSDNILLRIETESGLVGWGEAASAPGHGGSDLASMEAFVKAQVVPRLLGQSVAMRLAITDSLYACPDHPVSAIAAVDLALFDLMGKHLGVPIHTLVGGARRARIQPLWLIGNPSIAQDQAEVEKRVGLNYRFFKLKLGVKTLAQDIDNARALHRQFGDSIRLCADANMGFSVDQTLEYARAVRGCLAYLEQPIDKYDMAGLRAITTAGDVPIGLDEGATSENDILRQTQFGIAGVSLKSLKLGGISGVIRAADLCSRLGLQINLSGKVAETSISSAALLHMAAVVPSVDWGTSPSHLFLQTDIVERPFAPVNGEYPLPMGPGLGIEVDESKVAQVRI
jgi:muconate cycloisomerase